MQLNVGTKDLDFKDFLSFLKDKDKIEVYTDGSCIGNPGPGGWGVVFVSRDKRANLSGFDKDTTNNRMELMAAIKGIEAIPQNISIVLYTDSAYLKNGITSWIHNWKKNNWRSSSGKPVKNKDLWEQLSRVIQGRNIEWNWVKGHSDCTNNNNADFVARSAIVSSYMENEDGSLKGFEKPY